MSSSRPLPTSDEDFDDHLNFIRELMGANFDRTWRRFKRAKATTSTPHYHRLMYLYDRLTWSREGMKRTPKECDILSVVEIEFVKGLFAKWKDHPIHREIRNDIVTPRGYVHALCLLAKCQQNREHERNYDIDPIPADSVDGSISDARIRDGYGGELLYEMKAPDVLLQPQVELSQAQANDLVERAFKKAKGQIGHQPSGLAIGGLYVNHLTRERIASGFEDHFRRKKPRQIAFGELCSVGIYFQNISVTDSDFTFHPHSNVEPRIELQLIGNPFYEGKQKVILESGTPDSESVTELTIHPGKSPIRKKIR